MRKSFLLLLGVAALGYSAGTWVDTTFIPPSLGFESPVMVYLPEGYDPEGTIDYPVIYWLHGWGHHYFHNFAMQQGVLDSLILADAIEPVIWVKPEGACEPYNGSMWVNSALYGNFGDCVTNDLVAWTDSSFCTIDNRDFRCLAGHSMGASGSMDLALRHPGVYKAVASDAGHLDLLKLLELAVPIVIGQSPETEPPYSYDWGNGFYTDGMFLFCGGYSPNMASPPYYVDFIIDGYGDIVEGVYDQWKLHNPCHLVKVEPPSADLGIFFCVGGGDEFPLACCESYSDTLSSVGVEHSFFVDSTTGHPISKIRLIQMILFLNGRMLGIDEEFLATPSASIYPASPNPFTSSTTISFQLPVACNVQLDVYDVSGRIVKTLVDEALPEGLNQTFLSDHGLKPGVYILKLTTPGGIVTESCLLLR
ncbi:MAG: T9SS type A sorting domain-containing protein [Candidatus Sabulitectum sp.]|nr:T9SS type A sorting domain-containing protein [Candidatus Sabulitectum sp.]